MAKHFVHICRNNGRPGNNGVVIKGVGNSISHYIAILPDNSAKWLMRTDGPADILLGEFKLGDNVLIECNGRRSKWRYIKPPVKDPIERVFWDWNIHLDQNFIHYPKHGEVNKEAVTGFDTDKMSFEAFVERFKEDASGETEEGYFMVEYEGSVMSGFKAGHLLPVHYEYNAPLHIAIKPEVDKEDKEAVARAIRGLFRAAKLGTSEIVAE